jgi:hypothetical protein
MALSYTDALNHYFGSGSFSSSEFARRTGNPRAAKVLSELKHRGIVERLGRGRYRCLAPGERPDLREREWGRVRAIALRGPGPKAWTGETAVEAWTGGRYVVSPSTFLRVFDVAVPETRLAHWERYLAKHGVSTRTRKRVGARVNLHPVASLKAVKLHGEPVVPRSDIERLIDEHPALYGNAKELLIDDFRKA